MIPMGACLRKCVVCGYPISARDDVLTAHEIKCLEIENVAREKNEK